MFVLRYRDDPYNTHPFVVRDDSVGPMSSGGYPYPTNDIYQATLFETAHEAKEYDHQDQFDLYEITLTVGRKIEPTITTVEVKHWI